MTLVHDISVRWRHLTFALDLVTWHLTFHRRGWNWRYSSKFAPELFFNIFHRRKNLDLWTFFLSLTWWIQPSCEGIPPRRAHHITIGPYVTTHCLRRFYSWIKYIKCDKPWTPVSFISSTENNTWSLGKYTTPQQNGALDRASDMPEVTLRVYKPLAYCPTKGRNETDRRRGEHFTTRQLDQTTAEYV